MKFPVLLLLALFGFTVAAHDFNIEKHYVSMDDCMNEEDPIFQRSRFAPEATPCDAPLTCQEVKPNVFVTVSCESEIPEVPENHPHVTYGYYKDAQCEELYFGTPEEYEEDSYVVFSVTPNTCHYDPLDQTWFILACNEGNSEGRICSDSACSSDCSEITLNSGCLLGYNNLFYPADSYTKVQCEGTTPVGPSVEYYVFVLYRTLFSQLRNLEGFLAMNDEFKDTRVFTVIYEEQNGVPNIEKGVIAYGDEYLHCSPRDCSFQTYPPLKPFGFELVKEDEFDIYFYQYQLTGNNQKRYLAFDEKFFLTQRPKFAVLMKASPANLK